MHKTHIGLILFLSILIVFANVLAGYTAPPLTDTPSPEPNVTPTSLPLSSDDKDALLEKLGPEGFAEALPEGEDLLAWVAADLLAQAEHDVLATAILLTPSRRLAEAVQAEVEKQVANLSRADIIAQSLAGQGGIVITPDLTTAVRLADAFAPEHLCLSVADPAAWVDSIRNAGGIFLGEHSFEVLGDYVAGPSHIMPTGGTARFKGPVNVLDFIKVVNIIGLDVETARALAPDAATIADAESLTAHGAAAKYRGDVSLGRSMSTD